MKRFLDANVLCRYLLNDVPDLAQRARTLLASRQELWINLTALLETAQVLRYKHGMTTRTAALALIGLIREPGIHLHQLDYYHTVDALLFCVHFGADFGDALLWATARAEPGAEVYTFDQRFPSERIVVREP